MARRPYENPLHPARPIRNDPRIGRREFLTLVGGAAAGVTLAQLAVACSGDRGTAPVAASGSVRGAVTDLHGHPQTIGRIYLLQKSGLNLGRYVDVDATGSFVIGGIDPGDYQVRYWAGSQAYVPDPLPNPLRITVNSGEATVVQFQIELGAEFTNGREIYAGDDFYQEQPFGDANATVVVSVGTTICWYNVGIHDHTITGGPWRDSGTLHEADSFMWTADRTGTFPYQCSFHGPQMQAVLQVVA